MQFSRVEQIGNSKQDGIYSLIGMRCLNKSGNGIPGIVIFGEQDNGLFMHESKVADEPGIDVGKIVELAITDVYPISRFARVNPGAVYMVSGQAEPCIAVAGSNGNVIGYLIPQGVDAGQIIQATCEAHLGTAAIARRRLAG